MKYLRAILAVLTVVCGTFFGFVWISRTHAMEFPEVKPYVFATLPHARIYKTVHEGCELYIVESGPESADIHYSITAGRGCK